MCEIDREAILLRNQCYINTTKPDVPENIPPQTTVSQYYDVGYFYCPYLPVIDSPVVLDPEVYEKNKKIMTRYGRKLLEEGGKHYGKINLKEE